MDRPLPDTHSRRGSFSLLPAFGGTSGPLGNDADAAEITEVTPTLSCLGGVVSCAACPAVRV
jgi:hypothetical protein